MFGKILAKECKGLLQSIIYYIFIACMVLFYISQFSDVGGITKPIPGQKSYGNKKATDKIIIMNAGLQNLVQDYESNHFLTYPLGFYKEVKLDVEDKKKVWQNILRITGSNSVKLKTNIKMFMSKYNDYTYHGVNSYLHIRSDINYNEYISIMKGINSLLGGGSDYRKEKLENTQIPKTYNDAIKDYNNILHKDKVSGAFARLFADYMGIVLGILPVFLAVNRGLKDKRSKACTVIYCKKASSASIILSRYLAIIIMILIPLLILSINPMLQSMYCANANGANADMFAFVKVIFMWLMPTVLTTVSIGFFFTELTNSALAILVQVVFWFVSLMTNIAGMVGGVGLNLIPRFNSLGDYEVYASVSKQLVFNRMFYSLIGVMFLAATIVVFQLKRKGVLNINGKIFSNRKSKPEM